MTKKDFITKYNNKLFKRVVMEGTTLEDMDTMRKNLQELADNNGLELTENDNSFEIENRIWWKPTYERETTVRVQFKGGIYRVADEDGEEISRGDIPPAGAFRDGAMHIETFYGEIKYIALDK